MVLDPRLSAFRVCLRSSFNTMYLDLREWTVCKLPMLKTMPLQDFWHDADLQVMGVMFVVLLV